MVMVPFNINGVKLMDDKCPIGYSCNIGDMECEICENWILIQIISDRYPFGYAVRRCKLDVDRV